MQQWSEYERAQMAALKGPPKTMMECKECGAHWFQTLQAHQFDTNKISALGQAPVPEESYYILKCVRCGELHEPPTQRHAYNQEAKTYDAMLDELGEPKEEHGGRRAQRRAEEASRANQESDDSNLQPEKGDS